jgi:hypothetical protein
VLQLGLAQDMANIYGLAKRGLGGAGAMPLAAILLAWIGYSGFTWLAWRRRDRFS